MLKEKELVMSDEGWESSQWGDAVAGAQRERERERECG